MTPSPAFESSAIILVFIVLLLARRTIGQLYGARYSVGRLFAIAGLYVLLFVLLGFGTLFAAVGTWGPAAYALLAPYAIVPVVAAVVTVPYVARVVRFERRSDGNWYYRLSWHIPVLYLALFVTRIGAEFAILGPSAAFTSYPPPAPASDVGLAILVGVDLLFGVSLGLLIGRGIGVYRAHRALPKDGGAPSPPPLPGG